LSTQQGKEKRRKEITEDRKGEERRGKEKN
jgi:hypothetical protein